MSEIQQLEAYLQRELPAEELLLMEARLLLNQELREKAEWQQRTYALVQRYGQKQLRAEIETVHTKLFSDKRFSRFRQTILSIFKK